MIRIRSGSSFSLSNSPLKKPKRGQRLFRLEPPVLQLDELIRLAEVLVQRGEGLARRALALLDLPLEAADLLGQYRHRSVLGLETFRIARERTHPRDLVRLLANRGIDLMHEGVEL